MLRIVEDERMPPGVAAFVEWEVQEVTVVINGLEMKMPMKVPVLKGLIKFGENGDASHR